LRIMTPEILEILTNKEAIAIDQDPLGKQGYRFMDHRGKEIWIRELSGGNWAVCIFNDEDVAFHLRINWEHVYILNGKYEVRDIWSKKDLGTTEKNMQFEIPAHNAVLLKLKKVTQD
jgi:alpha-galactosidase